MSWEFAGYSGGAPYDDDVCVGGAELPAIDYSNVEIICATMYMYDSFGDSWNGNYFEIDGQTGTVDSGSYAEQEVCLEPGCYDLFVGGGSWQSEVSWEFGDASGGAPYDQ